MPSPEPANPHHAWLAGTAPLSPAWNPLVEGGRGKWRGSRRGNARGNQRGNPRGNQRGNGPTMVL
ncbi:MAG: hypothetical protein CWE10_11575 [Symbiobacterium thermophilum]|uniref:Uncharacterized protein n=1 Tax=Symbiobacterium thermophilum TaxID=2734 RepID=A0A953I9F6_SYMTR|nr:hypothetical protein [Symbiobacterium thermophilum]